jgi:hypothetical protein
LAWAWLSCSSSSCELPAALLAAPGTILAAAPAPPFIRRRPSSAQKILHFVVELL